MVASKAELLSGNHKAFHFFTTTWSSGQTQIFEDMSAVLGVEPISTLAVQSADVKTWKPSSTDFYVCTSVLLC